MAYATERETFGTKRVPHFSGSSPLTKGRKIGVHLSLLRMASAYDTVSGSDVLEAGKRKEEEFTGTKQRYSHSIVSISINVTSYDI